MNNDEQQKIIHNFDRKDINTRFKNQNLVILKGNDYLISSIMNE